uniref:ATP synthase F(0) complex subunit e, mitochondrial n=1 Tax=Ditylenchus dipsaci TaxID=166011 RepID=A0A915E527_9BILA
MSSSRANHPTTVVLPEPINVSPLIRFARWTALGLGVLYGAYHLRQIRAYHADIREYEFQEKYKAAQEKARKKKWLERDQMKDLMKAIGVSYEEGVSLLSLENLYRED